mmetsp:Transcript_58135/g.149672  ORF Transcript_58135/g.149672 Transcript_58135/m.149672 type:complete len:130 (+) Transcript_58135:520-909(+)
MVGSGGPVVAVVLLAGTTVTANAVVLAMGMLEGSAVWVFVSGTTAWAATEVVLLAGTAVTATAAVLAVGMPEGSAVWAFISGTMAAVSGDGTAVVLVGSPINGVRAVRVDVMATLSANVLDAGGVTPLV